ncbi:aminopeptidase P family protein [Mucilaginibacter gynuensis]|uniref:Aminopeptidase P family protein n=1 Tax=Mucilaginibacter gynuensis TaxID=1302236 RepID=A0ABP8GDK6_9SPHI
MTYKEKLAAIRSLMKENGVSAYIIASADPHISEYVPDRYKCLHFASGFTGSAGTLVITESFAGLWSDFRYFVQANEQLENTGFELVKLKVQHAPEYIDWLHETLNEGDTVAFDFQLMPILSGELLEGKLATKSIGLKNIDLLNPVWKNRPALPADAAFLIDEQFTGQSVQDKLAAVRDSLKKQGAAYHLVSSLDDMAWLFNIRGNDVSYNPVVLSFALINADTATLYIDNSKIADADKQKLQQSGVAIKPYEAIADDLQQLPADTSIFIDPKRNCFGFLKLLPAGVKVIKDINPSTHFKAVKNNVEVANIRQAMVKDGVAITRFFKWAEENVGNISITELSAAEKLKGFRAEQDGFAGVSFNTIGGYKAHGALPHYAATPESDSEILPEGLFLIDSGGQYFYGTTDITRMMPLGNNTDEESTDYTLVLKAMIEGSGTLFPKGTCGYQIDAICRKPMWDYARNYGHGTGHGIGFYLNVHEGPQVFNATATPIPVELGMITSIEPGIYRPGKHGIRIENLVLTIENSVNEFGEFYAFETLTLAHIDTRLIKKDLLEQYHINWLNQYHQTVYDRLSPQLNDEEKQWLKEKTKAI